MMQVQHSFLLPDRYARLLTVLSLLVLAMALSADALAASRNFVVESGARRPAARLALVIGNDYAGESGRLENPLNDAIDMRKALAKLGFEVMGDDQQGLEDMTRLVREFGDRLRPGMVGLFYFAGHGMQINGQNYLIPERSGIQREDEVPFRALAVDQVLAKMGHNQTGLNLLMLDACRDNPFTRAFRSNTTGLARMDAPAGTLISYAAKPGTRSKDGSGRNGLYTGVLLKYLPIPGLPIEQMLKKVGAEVRQRSGDSQQTWMEGLLDSGDGGDFCFAGCGGAPTPNTPPYRPVAPAREPTPTLPPIPQRQPVTPTPRPAPARACDDCPEMVRLPGGTFTMGSPDNEPGRGSDERQRRVTVSGFAIGRYEVTQAQWRAVMGDKPSGFKDCDQCPVEQVSCYDIQDYLQRLNDRTGQRYRLPTEEEWEYACRAGGTHIYCGADDIERVAWYGRNSSGKTHPVGLKRANRFGLYDMSGNVWEWTDSCYEGDCSRRVFRGGFWNDDPEAVRAAFRYWTGPAVRVGGLGFRLAQD